MKFDWQTVAVALIVAGALLYVARRALMRLRSFRTKGSSSCATGCGNCGDVDAPLRRTNVLTTIGRTKK
ncbi:MAG TPA: hypothetical protein VNZ44_20540 [Pyrinomonadaceae bacterium]|nr:hypothetical protein [Pyrinomonadaceae bacterium]